MPHHKRLEAAHDEAVRIAESLDLHGDDREQQELRLAHAIMNIRAHITTLDGGTDWNGRTHEAKSRAAEVYSSINSGDDDIRALKGRLRQRFDQIRRERLSYDELASLAASEPDTAPSGDFFAGVGYYIGTQGRPSTDPTEAATLIVAARKLVELIDADAVVAAGPPDCAAMAAIATALRGKVDDLIKALSDS